MAVLLDSPVPLSVELTGSVVLDFSPRVVPLTFTTIVQEPSEAKVPPVRATELLPAVAVTVPLQVLLNPFGVPTIRPAGSGSVKARPVSAVPTFGLVIVMLRVVAALSSMLEAPNCLLITGDPVL